MCFARTRPSRNVHAHFGNARDLIVQQSRIPQRLKATRTQRAAHNQRIPTFPRNAYGETALRLYQYGRHANGLPLLEFQGYYQAIEHYFPHFVEAQTLANVRRRLRNPAFDVERDTDLAALIRTVRTERVQQSERDQFKLTLGASVPEPELLDFFAENPETEAALFAQKSQIEGARCLNLKQDMTLAHQIADRLYTIRCRIVHAKQDGGAASLPYSYPAPAKQKTLDTTSTSYASSPNAY